MKKNSEIFNGDFDFLLLLLFWLYLTGTNQTKLSSKANVLPTVCFSKTRDNIFIPKQRILKLLADSTDLEK